MLKRGRRDGSPGLSLVSRCVDLVNGGPVLLPLRLVLVSDDPEVVVVDDPEGPLISVVDTGGVEVMVSVVVTVVVVDACDENDGSTKSFDGPDESPPPATNMTAPTRTAMTARPAALAPTTALVELCQGSSRGPSPPNSSTNSSSPNSLSRSVRATATDISTATCADAGSGQLRDDLGCEQLEVIEIRHIQ
jgi:hypothetical protein